jgi:hypothetical protein
LGVKLAQHHINATEVHLDGVVFIEGPPPPP